MLRIKNLEQTCWACPSQWEGQTEDGSEFYARYRHGYFYATVNCNTIFAAGLSDDDDGCMNTDEMLKLINAEEY